MEHLDEGTNRPPSGKATRHGLPAERASSGSQSEKFAGRARERARHARQPGEKHAEILASLGALSADLFTGDEWHTVLDDLLAQIRSAIHSPYAALFRKEAEVSAVERATAHQMWSEFPWRDKDGHGNGHDGKVSPRQSLLNLLEAGQPVCAAPADIVKQDGQSIFPPVVRSILLLPVTRQGELWGVLCLGHQRWPQQWPDKEIEALVTLAKTLGAALEVRGGIAAPDRAVASENEGLYAEARQRANELELLHQVAIATATLMDVDRLIEETTRFIAERIYTDVFGFLLLDEDAGEFRPHPSYHGLPPGGPKMPVPLNDSISGRVVRTGRPMIVPDVSCEPLYYPIVEETRSEISVPMRSGDRVIGVINVESRKRAAFSDSDLRFLKTLAGQVVTAIERAQLYADMETHASRLAEKVRERTNELEEERDRMLAILDTAGEGIVFTDIEARILYVNPAMERQTGYTREECMGRTPRLWKSERTDAAVFRKMWQTVLDGKRWQGELVNKRRDGTHFDAALTITPLYDRESQISGFVSIQADISRLKEVDRLKSEFITNVSHELRTPLTNIRTYLSLLERGSQDQRERYLGVIGQETGRLTRLIQDLLDLSTLEAHKTESNRVSVNVGPIITKVMRTFAAEAQRKEIALKNDVPERLPPLLAVESQLQQVLNNLVGNALAYTPPGGRVNVTAGRACRKHRPIVWLRVVDDGPGIQVDEMPHLFARFFRGSAARRSDSPGTGLGLSICREILDNHGGHIDVDSAPGQGSTFTVWWPLSG